MNKIVVGVIYAFGVLYSIGAAYNKGKHDGEQNVLKMMDFANKVAEHVKKNEEEA